MEPEFEVNEELAKQISALSAHVHALLHGPNGDGELTGEMEMQRVTLEVPRAFVVLATFLATFDPKQNVPNSFWEHDCEGGQNIDHKLARNLMRGVLKRALYETMDDRLHWLATHWFAAEMERDVSN